MQRFGTTFIYDYNHSCKQVHLTLHLTRLTISNSQINTITVIILMLFTGSFLL